MVIIKFFGANKFNTLDSKDRQISSHLDNLNLEIYRPCLEEVLIVGANGVNRHQTALIQVFSDKLLRTATSMIRQCECTG